MSNNKRSIDPETLRRWLVEGREVQVLDVAELVAASFDVPVTALSRKKKVEA